MKSKFKHRNAERKWDRMVIPLIAYSCTMKEFNESDHNNNNHKLNRQKSLEVGDVCNSKVEKRMFIIMREK